jgi:hypothetical protein
MSYLTVFSETGFPHAATLLEYIDGTFEWLGFEPTSGALGGNGYIDTSNQEPFIEYYIRYYIDDSMLRTARNNTVTYYWTCVYQMFTCNCVSVARDLANACGLYTFGPSFIPSSLVYDVARYNVNYSNFNDKPFPWRLSSPISIPG